MEETQKKDSSSDGLKEKTSLLDMDIGKNFLSNWKSMSMTEGDGMDFDLTPVSKGNKKSFDFGKADMDFNLDGDFGKMSSFNMDMSDLDISPPLRKDGKFKEKSKESSSGKDKGKADHFGFAFDFDELENFSFGSNLTKEGSKAQNDKDTKESSPSESGCQAKESSMDLNLIGDMSTSEVRPQKPSLPQPMILFNMDLEPKRKNFTSKLAMDDAVISKHSAANDKFSSDKAKTPPETTIAAREITKTCDYEKSNPVKPVDREACIGNDAMKEFLSDVNSSEALEKTEFMDKIAIASNGEQDVNVHSRDGSNCNYNHTVSENSHLQTVAISEKNNGKKSHEGIECHAVDNKERTDLSPVNPHVENTCITNAVSQILSGTTSRLKNPEPASEILKLPLVSQPSDPFSSKKESERGREPHVTCLRTFIQSQKLECPGKKASTQATLSSLSSKKMGFEGRGDWTSIQSDKKLQHPKTLLRRELPQVQSQESCKGPNISRFCREVHKADGLENRTNLNGSPTTRNKDMVKITALRQIVTSVKDADISSSMEINKTTAEEDKHSTFGGGKKTPDLQGLKLSNLNLGSTKSPIRKDISQKKVLLRDTSINTSRFGDLQKQSHSTLSMKRKASEENMADTAVSHPSKRPFESPTTSRNIVETSQRVFDKKVPNSNYIEDDHIKSPLGNSQVSTSDIPHEISFSFENNSNIKQAEAYTKELDDLCNMLKKKQEVAKEMFVKAIVNSNKLLMLNYPLLEEKIRALFAGLTLNSVHG